MIHRVPARAKLAIALLAAIALAACLSACGTSLRHPESDDASADVDAAAPGSCPATALEALGSVAKRVYREGIVSERVDSARHMIEGSDALRSAVEADNAQAARAAAKTLIATGHLTDLRIVRGGKVLIDVGGPALAPVRGTLAASGAAGGARAAANATPAAGAKPLASYVTSVWAAGGLIAETSGIAQGATVIRSASPPAEGRTFAGAFELPVGDLPPQGTLTHDGAAYQFTSYPASAYPDGAPLRVYVLRAISSIEPTLCGATQDDTTVNALSRIAHLIYDGEAGQRTGKQIRRVQGNRALLEAVAHRDAKATRAAVEALLHQHIVRLRVSAGGRLLSDVGGPYVLAPVTAPLRLGGRTIGSFVLSIQDDEGYKRLANRLAGLDVLMYMGSRLVKSTIGYSPGAVPTRGPFSFHGRNYRAYTFSAQAFPSGPLRITVLIPLPYS
ncbi:MAG TPA: hypothetical protein VHW67_02975 [Solirubrobacteraceae bacterium]|jgi:hypothetical protein|nr:hypothetical protein [Solirubrobacteraceae bacterium]